jgi:hypothetical protein
MNSGGRHDTRLAEGWQDARHQSEMQECRNAEMQEGER